MSFLRLLCIKTIVLINQALEVVSYNLNRQNKQLKLYEFGNVYGKNEEGYKEEKRLSITKSLV